MVVLVGRGGVEGWGGVVLGGVMLGGVWCRAWWSFDTVVCSGPGLCVHGRVSRSCSSGVAF